MALSPEQERIIQKRIPDHTCARCKRRFKLGDRITFVFIMIDPDACNPNRPTERGLSLGTDCEFMHCDCSDPSLEAAGMPRRCGVRRRDGCAAAERR